MQFNSVKVIYCKMDEEPDYINKLPDEVLLKIFSYLTIEELVRFVKLVCKRWLTLSQDKVLWKELTYRPNRKTHSCNVICIFKNAQNLRNFVPEVCLPRSVIDHLMANCKELRRLEFSNDQGLELKQIHEFIENFPHVESFSAKMYTRYDTLICLSKWKNLKRVKLTGTTTVLNYICEGICECDSLEEINIGNLQEECMICINNIHKIIKQKSQNLKSFTFTTEFVEPSTLQLLLTCPKLEGLGIHNLSNSRGIDFSQLHVLELKSLALVRFNESAEYLKDTIRRSSWSKLKKLNLTFYKLCNDAIIKAVIEKCPDLEELILEGCYDITDDGLADLWKLPNLEHLDISRCPLLTNKALEHVSKCEKLVKFSIKGNEVITDDIFHELVKCKRLTKIYLDNCSEIVGYFIPVLYELQYLWYLSLEECESIDRDILTEARKALKNVIIVYFR